MKRLALALLLFAGPAFAAAGITSMTINKFRNLNSVGIEAIVGGDDDSSAVLRIFQHLRGAASYDTGMVMVRRPHGPIAGVTTGTAGASGEIFEGRILGVGPSKLVDFYVEGIDAGGNLSSNPDTTSCAGISPPWPIGQAQGPVFYAATWGSALGPGDIAHPYNTITNALTALSTSLRSGQNGGVILWPGEYHERIDLNFGTDGYPRFLQGMFPGMDQQIICGENEMVRSGNYAAGSPIVWQDTGQDSTWKCYFPSTGGPGDSTGLVIFGSREQLHRKTSIKAILDDSTKVSTSSSSTNEGELSGWFWQNDTLYIKRRTGAPPTSDTMHTGYRNDLCKIQRRNWHISNITFRYAGGITDNMLAGGGSAEPNPGGNGNGILAGLLHDGGGLTVDSCYFYGLNSAAIYGPQGAGGTHGPGNTFTCDTMTIAHCYIDGLSVGGMRYSAGKSRIEERACQIVLNSYGSNVYANTIENSFNGIQTSGGGATNTDTTGGSHLEVYGNFLRNMPDDGIELDGSHNINTLVQWNTTRNTNSGTSITPIFTGPVFFANNLFTHWRQFGVKVGGGSLAFTRFWQNTIASPVTSATAIDASTGGVARNLWFENNIIGGSGQNHSMFFGPSDTTGSTLGTYNINYNCLDSTATSNLNIANWPLNTVVTFINIRNFSPPWEKNGFQGIGSAFTDSSAAGGYNYVPGTNSPARWRGRRITGVNTGVYGNKYPVGGPGQGAITVWP